MPKKGCNSSLRYEIQELKKELRYYANAGRWDAAVDTAERLGGLLPRCK